MAGYVTLIDFIFLPIWSALVFGAVSYIRGNDFVYAAIVAFMSCGGILISILMRGSRRVPDIFPPPMDRRPPMPRVTKPRE